MNPAAEIGVAAILQLGALLWFLSSLKSDMRNLSGWVQSLDKRAAETATLASELKGKLEVLLCTHEPR